MNRKLLPEVCDVQYGFAFDSKKFSNEEGVALVRIRDVVRGYSETKTTEDCPDNYVVNDGDLLIGMDGDFNIAKWKGGRALLNQRVCKLIPHAEDIDLDYFYYYMPIALKAIEEKTPYVTVKHLSAKEINRISIPIPDLPIQQKRAKILLATDNNINHSKLYIDKLDELIKSRFVEMFGDCKLNPKQWNTIQLGEIADVGSSKRVFVGELKDIGVPFYRGTEIGALAEKKHIKPELFITKEHYEKLISESGQPQKGDLLMPSICPDGRIWLVDDDSPFYFKDGRVLWVHNIDYRFNSTFLLYTLKDRIMTDYSSIASGTTFAELKIFALKKCNIFDVPLDLQERFEKFINTVEQQKSAIQKSLEKLEILKKSLMQEYFG